jgi:hypothetical protein
MSLWRVIMLQTIPSIGATYENVVHFKSADTATNVQLADDLQANFMPHAQNFQSWFLGWQYLYVYKIATPLPPVYIRNLGNDSASCAHVGYLYPTTGYKWRIQTTVGGRHGRGRFYVGGSRSDWATAGGITSDAATNGGIHLAAIVNRYKSGGTSQFVWCLRPPGGSEIDCPSMVSASFWQYLGMQRRRQYGVGI